jgi:outer membrane protein OmpA-like peptidoglycan-associated protein
MHGPFVRVAYNWGAPPLAPAMAAAPPPPPPAATTAKSFIVFFDFDRSNITAQAQATINDAVAAAKAGNSTRITLTGHTDRSGSEQYNQALSVRRGEAVKAAMIRGGIPANAIVVIGRGESQPLVQTPDGVREPQNRRVEIVI